MTEEEVQDQRLELVLELAYLEKEREKEINKLRRKVKQTISAYNFEDLQTHYINVRQLHSRLIPK